MKAKTSTQRGRKRRERNKRLGRKRKEYQVTDAEHAHLLKALTEFRAKELK